jgi:hypothetical protein
MNAGRRSTGGVIYNLLDIPGLPQHKPLKSLFSWRAITQVDAF